MGIRALRAIPYYNEFPIFCIHILGFFINRFFIYLFQYHIDSHTEWLSFLMVDSLFSLQIQESTNAEMPADSMKLIHSGKVLKDEDVLKDVGIKENDFMVVMITKKKAAAPAPAAAAPKTPAATKKEDEKMTDAAPAPATTTATPAPSTAAAATSTSTSSAATTTPAPTASTTTPAAPAQPSISDAAVENLTGMGFPEEAVRHCLRVAQGNPDLAVEFLTNGIPEGMEQAMQAARGAATPAAGGSSSGSSSSSSNQPLQALRNHPQFNDLRRLVQSNPQMLQQVLTQIGQQQPELLQEINANQALFLQMMNEPVEEGSSSGGGGGTGTSSSAPSAGASSAPADSNPFSGGMGNPMQMAQMIQSMNPEELGQMAQMMGVSPDQLRTTAQMIGQMPPEQLNQFIMQAMGGGGMEGMFGGGEGGGAGGGPQVLRLTDEEMAAVDRLTEMGFDRAEAAQAFLACDKNEALAANLLMDSMMGDNDNNGGGGGGNNNNNNNGGGDEDEDMYD